MTRTTHTTARAVLTAAVLATTLALTACGGGGSTTSGTASPGTASAPASASASASASAPTGGADTAPVADEKIWISVLKKTMPALDSKSDAEILTQAKKVCTDFKANPTNAGANAGVSAIQSALGLDSTYAKVFASASVSQYCADQGEAYMKASIAG